MDRQTYNQGSRGGYGDKPFGQNRQRGGQGGSYNQGGFQKFGDRQDREGGFQKPKFGGPRQDRDGQGGYQNKENYYNQNRGQDSSRGGQGYQGGFSKRGGRQDANASMMSGGSHFSKKPSSSLVAISVNPEEAKVQKLSFVTNQFSMKMGQNAPQIFQYPINLFSGEAPDVEEENSFYKFTPLELSKVVEREKSRIELLVGKFIYSGFNIWTTQQLD